jgi:RNA polymerase sigma-70 factor (ECF subfamily)
MQNLSPHTSDEKLLQDLRLDSNEAFEAIFKKYWQVLLSQARSKLQSTEEAEEIVQNIFSTLWEKRHGQEINNLSIYLQVSVRNRIINHIRQKITQRKYWDYYKKFIPVANEETGDAVLYNDLSESVQRAIQKLPHKSQQVFRLSRIEGQSTSEIARRLNLSEKAIQYHLTQSLKSLRLQLKDFILAIAIAFFI